jgi:hypothetical protein
MQTGSLKLWRSQVACWAFFALFLVLAGGLLYTGRELTKSYTEPQRHALLFMGGICGFVAILSVVLAWRARRTQHELA